MLAMETMSLLDRRTVSPRRGDLSRAKRILSQGIHMYSRCRSEAPVGVGSIAMRTRNRRLGQVTTWMAGWRCVIR